MLLSYDCANREIMAKVGAEKRVVFPGDRFGWLTVLDRAKVESDNGLPIF